MINVFALRYNPAIKDVSQYFSKAVSSHEELFKLRLKDINLIFPEQDWNFHYTIADCTIRTRSGLKKDIIVYDIDDIDLSQIPLYIEILASVTNTDASKCVQVHSGHGIHYIIKLTQPIFAKDNNNLKPRWIESCNAVNKALRNANLPGRADTDVWDMARIMRFPDCKNVKPIGIDPALSDDITQCFIMGGELEAQNFSFEAFSGDNAPKMPHLQVAPELQEEESAFQHDPLYVLQECAFLREQHAAGGEHSKEPAWRAYLGTIGRLPGGQELAHEGSQKHSEYDEEKTQSKLEDAIRVPPRTCLHIAAVDEQDSCSRCKWKGLLHSPMGLIEGREKLLKPNNDNAVQSDKLVDGNWEEEFLEDLQNGFSYYEDQGKGKKPKIYRDFDRLVDYLYKDLNAKLVPGEKSSEIFVWKDNCYKLFRGMQIKARINTLFSRSKPPSSNDILEAYNRFLYREENIVAPEDFFCRGALINFRNGVYDIEKDVLLPHNPKHYFQYVLDYDYDPTATCPTFDKFMHAMTMGVAERKKILLQYGGYCMNSEDILYQNFLVLDGEGSNGKTTFLRLLKSLLSDKNTSQESLQKISSVNHMSIVLLNKKLAICEEENKRCFSDTSFLKQLTSFEEITINRKNGDIFKVQNRAKIIMTYNKMPYLNDDSQGMKRRMLIVKCEQNYEKNTREKIPYIDEKLLAERSGIFNVMIAAYRELKENGGFLENLKYDTNRAVQKMIEQSCEVASFAETYLAFTGSAKDYLVTDDLYDRFVPEYGNRITKINFMRTLMAYARNNKNMDLETKSMRIKNQFGNNTGFKRIILGIKRKLELVHEID